MCCLVPGDIDLANGVNFVDYNLFAEFWGNTGCGPCSWCNKADCNQSGEVDFDDLKIFTLKWLLGASI